MTNLQLHKGTQFLIKHAFDLQGFMSNNSGAIQNGLIGAGVGGLAGAGRAYMTGGSYGKNILGGAVLGGGVGGVGGHFLQDNPRNTNLMNEQVFTKKFDAQQASMTDTANFLSDKRYDDWNNNAKAAPGQRVDYSQLPEYSAKDITGSLKTEFEAWKQKQVQKPLPPVFHPKILEQGK